MAKSLREAMRMTNDGSWSLDTSILIYATTADDAGGKRQIALSLLERLFKTEQSCLAGQVLSEYLSAVSRRKTMPGALAKETISVWTQAANILPPSEQAYKSAWELSVKHQYQVWDALIIAVCAEHGIKTLYSEDLGSLKRPLGVHVVNPFANLETV
jgi:predicted nucleic acid-binding protein